MPLVRVRKVKQGATLRGFEYATTFPDGVPFEGFVPYEAGDSERDIQAKIRLHFRVAVRAALGLRDDSALPDEFEFDV